MTTGERIKSRRKELGMSAEQLADILNVSAATIYRYEKGDIEKVPAKSLPLLAKALLTTPQYLMGWSDHNDNSIPAGFEPLPEMVHVPLVGRIACGEPILAEENIETHVSIPAGWHADFALNCVGDSMLPRIHDGDLVAIRCQPTVETGEIAAVRIGDEATLKAVYIHDGYIELRPLNPNYPSIIRPLDNREDIAIEGKAVGLCRGL